MSEQAVERAARVLGDIGLRGMCDRGRECEDCLDIARHTPDDAAMRLRIEAEHAQPTDPAPITAAQVEAAAEEVRGRLNVCGDDRGCQCEDSMKRSERIARAAFTAAGLELEDTNG